MRIPEHRTRHRRRGNNAHTPRPAPAGSCRRAKGCMAGRASPRHEPRGQRQGGSGHLPHPPCAPAAARGRADSALPCGGVAGRWAAAHASLIRGQRRAHARALQPARGRGGPSVSATTAGRQRVESVLAPPQAAGGALVEGGHRLVGRADLQLLVVRAVVAALGAVGCREWGGGGLRGAGKRWWWRGARAPSVWSAFFHASGPPSTSSTTFRSRVASDVTLLLSWKTYGHVRQKKRMCSSFCGRAGRRQRGARQASGPAVESRRTSRSRRLLQVGQKCMVLLGVDRRPSSARCWRWVGGDNSVKPRVWGLRSP